MATNLAQASLQSEAPARKRLVIEGDLSPGGDTRPDGMMPLRSAESIFNRLLDDASERRRVSAGLPPRSSAPLLEVLEAAE
jgi:hypothetical protein